MNLQAGEISLLKYHQERVNRSLLPDAPLINLTKALEGLVKQYEHTPSSVRHKVRLIYSVEGVLESIEGEEYVPREIYSLRLVEAPCLDYSRKYLNRECLELLRLSCDSTDEILITQGGELTDTSYSNIALWDGRQWCTSRRCLLKGTKRQYLIEKGILHEKIIRQEDISRYTHICLINALLNLGEIVLPVSMISRP